MSDTEKTTGTRRGRQPATTWEELRPAARAAIEQMFRDGTLPKTHRAYKILEAADHAAHMETMKTTASDLEGTMVRVVTRRGRTYEGVLHRAGNASCEVGIGGKVAYGGIVSIEPLDPARCEILK